MARWTYIILYWPVPELARKDIQQLPAAPSLLAVGVVGVMVGMHAAQSILPKVRSRPGIAWRRQDLRWRLEGVGLGLSSEPGLGFYCCERHGRRCRNARCAEEVLEDARGGRQTDGEEGRRMGGGGWGAKEGGIKKKQGMLRHAVL